jgi:hypothetical protein
VDIIIVSIQREPKECPNLLQLQPTNWESLHPASYRGWTHAKQELQCTRSLWRQHIGQQRGCSSRSTQHLIDQQRRQQPLQQKQQQSSGKNTQQDTNQISGQSTQAKNVNINETRRFPCLHYGVADYDSSLVLQQKKERLLS